MRTDLARFKDILNSQLIPEYCQGAFLASTPAEFRETPLHFAEEDARYFVMGWEARLLDHVGGGRYMAPRNAAGEKFFNAGPKSAIPRTFTLAQEAVITVGVLARLHFEFRWPRNLLGTQSKTYAFDAVACLPGMSSEYIACEVKKSPAEVGKLLRDMHAFCAAGVEVTDAVALNSGLLNAFRKVSGLQQGRAPIFWAVGPCGVSNVFRVVYRQDGSLDLVPDHERALTYPLT